MVEVLDVPLKETDVYYVGAEVGVKGGDFIPWSLNGVYTTLELAKSNAEDGEFIVRCPLNTKLPEKYVHPKQSWWVVNGELVQSAIFYEM